MRLNIKKSEFQPGNSAFSNLKSRQLTLMQRTSSPPTCRRLFGGISDLFSFCFKRVPQGRVESHEIEYPLIIGFLQKLDLSLRSYILLFVILVQSQSDKPTSDRFGELKNLSGNATFLADPVRVLRPILIYVFSCACRSVSSYPEPIQKTSGFRIEIED